MRKAEIKTVSSEVSLEDVTLTFGDETVLLAEAKNPSPHPVTISPINRKRSVSSLSLDEISEISASNGNDLDRGRTFDSDKMFGSISPDLTLNDELEKVNLADGKSSVKKLKNSNHSFERK